MLTMDYGELLITGMSQLSTNDVDERGYADVRVQDQALRPFLKRRNAIDYGSKFPRRPPSLPDTEDLTQNPQAESSNSQVKRKGYGGRMENLWQNFQLGCANSTPLYDNGNRHRNYKIHEPRSGNFLGHRVQTVTADGNVPGKYVWDTYAKVRSTAVALQYGLRQLGVCPKDCIGIYSINRPEWVITDLSAALANFITVPIYDTLGDAAVLHILQQTEMKVIVSSAEKALKILRLQISSREQKHEADIYRKDNGKGKAKDDGGHVAFSQLSTIVIMNDISCLLEGRELEDLAKKINVRLIKFRLVVKMGMESKATETMTSSQARRDDVATICYTSGTTGLPKGVILTHGNILAELDALETKSTDGTLFTPYQDDIHISYLPMAHIFERVMVFFMTRAGAQIGFYNGNTLTLMDDIAELRPTIFISVPRLFNKIYDKVHTTIEGKGRIATCMFHKAMRSKLNNLHSGVGTKSVVWDNLVFSKVRSRLGGHVRVIITGSAPIGNKVLDFLRIAFGAEVYEGYGQTETCAGLCVTDINELRSGHVGKPVPCCDIKLLDIPDMNYTTEDKPFPRGEILVRGDQIFKGYYKEPEKTRESFTEDGWYRTGDVGMIDERGNLVLIDRVKAMFKLSQGEYVAPEKIETILQEEISYIQQIFVTGKGTENSLVALIVADPERFPEDMKKDEKKRVVLKEIFRACKKKNLAGFEIPQNIRFIDDYPEELLTPTFKLKRNIAKQYYADIIEELYVELGELQESQKNNVLQSKL